jgi:16S rRNA (cytidine1402-2'-O)-methyltransferase
MTESPCPDSQTVPDPADAAPHPGVAGLVLVSTPIGNLGDMSPRAVTALRQARLVLCEDTRTSATLLRHYGIAARTEALHDHNEESRIPGVLARLAAGQNVALISDAGTPLMSDPGYRLVRAAIAAGHKVTAVPGANAAVTALVLSGLPPHPHLFAGFLPARQAARVAALQKLRAAEQAGLSATLLFYESPHRTAETLADMASVFGDRPAALARELTKLYEQVRRGTLAELAEGCVSDAPRGEIVLVVGPAPEETVGEADLDSLLRAALATQSVREAAAGVAAAMGLPKRVVYQRALELSAARA